MVKVEEYWDGEYKTVNIQTEHGEIEFRWSELAKLVEELTEILTHT